MKTTPSNKEYKVKSQMNSNSQTTVSGGTGPYRLGVASAFMMDVIILIQIIVFMVAPPPYDGTALDWFMLFQKNKFIGLIDIEFLMIVYTILSIPISLALYSLLKQVKPCWMAIYLALSLVGVMCFIAARPAIELLYLSNGYVVAGTDAQRAVILAAGEAKLATFHGTAFHISYILGSVTGLIISLVILRANIFSKATAYVRIASSVFDFGLFVPVIGTYISILSVLFLFSWNIMIARRLFQLGKDPSKEKANQIDNGLLAIPDHSN